MEVANRIANAVIRAVNNNTVINVCLVGSFVALGVRSVNQQKYIEALEAEKDSLVKSNKAMKKTMWDWKQQLFAESESHEALVPLARLKAIYDAVQEDSNSPVSKLSVDQKVTKGTSIWTSSLNSFTWDDIE
ncbi:hypothetical protein FEM48_Zijuj06G0127800 [Ziziphus jujuba var. spinosa]|uniref:Uncharacterized protein n=1 Tax=Ziziphus jujuba var. spinosa TaxID=714518 RepID=A0A978V9D2_ZIZJJ|nr:hypothetical protein FEM48_Zijuj06G0127800 [Ziziphus jujuba var. spinosa]